MFKRSVIFLTFLAYALTLAHDLVPHHHHDETVVKHHHHNERGKSHDHHDHEKKSLSHTFADATHHPSSGLVIQPSQVNIEKRTSAKELTIIRSSALLLPLFKPPDTFAASQTRHSSPGHFTIFLLRGPPVI